MEVKKPVGRPSVRPSLFKKNRCLRVNAQDFKLIKAKAGSLQKFFDEKLEELKKSCK